MEFGLGLGTLPFYGRAALALSGWCSIVGLLRLFPPHAESCQEPPACGLALATNPLPPARAGLAAAAPQLRAILSGMTG